MGYQANFSLKAREQKSFANDHAIPSPHQSFPHVNKGSKEETNEKYFPIFPNSIEWLLQRKCCFS